MVLPKPLFGDYDDGHIDHEEDKHEDGHGFGFGKRSSETIEDKIQLEEDGRHSPTSNGYIIGGRFPNQYPFSSFDFVSKKNL